MTDTTTKNWRLSYDAFEPEEEGLREALTSTGNGYFCTRGSFAWTDADDVHYPGTYMHGGYNRETTIMAGVPVLNEDLVNLPNWLLLELRIEDEEAVGANNVELLSYRHELDLRNAILVRDLSFRDRESRETTIETRRFVSMADRHQGAIEWRITPENWSGKVEIVTALDGRVTNNGVARYRELEGRHLTPAATSTPREDVVGLRARTSQSRIFVAQAARTHVYENDKEVEVERTVYQMDDYVHQILGFEVREKEPVRVEKMVSFYSSRDTAINEPLTNAEKSVFRFGTFEEALDRHARAWDELWSVCDVQVPGDDHVQQLLRVHISHILQVCSPHTADLDTGVPARGLNGEAYRGHIFWDELYIYPFLNFRLPEITREFLMYRYRRLDEARAAAKEARLQRGDVPLAERLRRAGRDTSRPPQPKLRQVGAGPLPQPAARKRRHLLQHLALLPRHRRLRVPARRRGRDDAGDRPLLVFYRLLRRRAGPLRDPRRHGPRRVSRKISRFRRRGLTEQCLHQRDGRLDLRGCTAGIGAAPRTQPRRPGGEDRANGTRRYRLGPR